MPADQQGSTYKTAKGAGIRWYDEHGERKRRAGFSSKSEARKWFRGRRAQADARRDHRPVAAHSGRACLRVLAQHVAEANTTRALRERLKLATAGIPVKPRSTEREHALGEIRVDRLDARTVAAWRKRLPEGSAWHAHNALRQVLGYAVRSKLTAENVAGVAR